MFSWSSSTMRIVLDSGGFCDCMVYATVTMPSGHAESRHDRVCKTGCRNHAIILFNTTLLICHEHSWSNRLNRSDPIRDSRSQLETTQFGERMRMITSISLVNAKGLSQSIRR